MELQFKNVSKDYGQVLAVDHVTYSMGKGVYGLLGVNGAGKTTLMRMLCTAINPTDGRILWNGKDIFRLGASYRGILGYLPQNYGFYPDLSVYEYMMYIASIKGLRQNVAKKRTARLLEQVGLSEKRKSKMRTLSGGMIRRVGIAQAMLNNPRILVLDEPTAGLDPNERIRFRNLISELSEDRSCTAVHAYCVRCRVYRKRNHTDERRKVLLYGNLGADHFFYGYVCMALYGPEKGAESLHEEISDRKYKDSVRRRGAEGAFKDTSD